MKHESEPEKVRSTQAGKRRRAALGGSISANVGSVAPATTTRREETAQSRDAGAMSDQREERAASEPRRDLPAAAVRALEEAEARRHRLRESQGAGMQSNSGGGAEIGGRDGPEPTRYGDWEKGGIVSDF